MTARKQFIVRCITIFVMMGALLFGMTWKNGFCVGDSFFGTLGLKAWSMGTQGFHYPTICSLVVMAVCIPVLSSTIRDKRTVLRYASKIFCAAVLLSAIVSLFKVAV